MSEKIVKLNLRLPGGLHRRLQKEAKQNNVSLNTEIINQLTAIEQLVTDRERLVTDFERRSADFERLAETTNEKMDKLLELSARRALEHKAFMEYLAEERAKSAEDQPKPGAKPGA
jgi:HicB family